MNCHGMTGVGLGFAGWAKLFPVTCRYRAGVMTSPKCPCSPPPNVALTELAFSMSMRWTSYSCW
eukprot:15346429-Ditylum_brightwellii.AAC.1